MALTRPRRTGTLPRTKIVPVPIVYLNLQSGFTTFAIENIERFRYVHFVTDSNGTLRKKFCRTSGCTYCASGSRRNLRMTMHVRHNGVAKTLEVGSALANRIINDFSVGDTITIEKMGSDLKTTYNIIGVPAAAVAQLSMSTTVDEKEEGIKELMYDLQRTNDYEEKYELIQSFVRKF